MILLPALVSLQVQGNLVNVTVTSNGHDPLTGAAVTYDPADSWVAQLKTFGDPNGGTLQVTGSMSMQYTPGSLSFQFTGKSPSCLIAIVS